MIIELYGIYNSDGVDYEALNLPVETALENSDQLPTIINTDTIETINPSSNGEHVTISFISGDRCMFAHTYEEVRTLFTELKSEVLIDK